MEDDKIPPPRDLLSSYDGYVIAMPKVAKEKTAFQHLLNKKMLFRAPETGPDRFREPHFGESTLEKPESQRWTVRRLTGGATDLRKGRKLPGKGTGIKKLTRANR